MESKTGGFLVISLDFELHWGMFDKVSIDEYGQNYLGVRQALPEMLALFAENNIHATWATVGMLMCENKDELLERIPRPARQPRYPDMKISAYKHIESTPIGQNEKDDPYHFAPSLVREIVNTPHQELASHTFSHYYCLDGQNNPPATFSTDIALSKSMCEKFSVTPSSIAFPRNQATETAILECFNAGLTCYRGTEQSFMYQPRRDDRQSLVVRGLRLLDAYFNLSGPNTTSLSTLMEPGPKNIPASRFLRPYSRRLRFLEKRRLNRIKAAMTHASKHNEIFHLWWHPHNFGVNRKENMDNLRSLINHFEHLKEAYGMQSRNMKELAEVTAAIT